MGSISGCLRFRDACPDHRVPADGRLRDRAGRTRAAAGTATLLVSIPTLYGVFAVIAFGIGVIIYGF